jgi:hypothetical protein
MVYSQESDVYEATGMKTEIVQKLGGKTSAEVTTLISSYITKADQRIKRLLGIPYTVRKEYHSFDGQNYVELGPSEDEFEFYGDYNPTNLVESVYAIYSSGRVKLPYPKDCDSMTEDKTDMNSSVSCTLTKETTIKKCGTASIKAVFTAAGSLDFPKNHNFDKNIETWDYIGFWFRTSDKTATYTLSLYDKDGNRIYTTFVCTIADTWQIIKLDIADFTGDYDFDEDRLCQYVKIESDKACTVYFDNFCFNDGFFWTYPQGLICWSIPDLDPEEIYIEVTYSYDPFKSTVPEDIEEASARMAGIRLLEYLIGCRQRITAFAQGSDNLDNYPDRETLEFTKARLEREIQEILAGIGFKTYSGMGTD